MKKIKIVVISLFDGLSGARVALSRVPEIEVLRYYSSEVDKYAIQIANKNFPQDEPYRLGDVTKIDGHKLLKEIKAEFGSDVKILLIGGSPCQGFSMSGKRRGSSTKDGMKVTELEQYLQLKKDGFEFDGQSYLFWEYKRIQNEVNPNFFLLENVRVTKEWLPMFNTAMEVEPTRINSALVSAQNRDRYYWTNLDIVIPKDKGIIISDILESCNKARGFNKGCIHKEIDKSPTLTTSSFEHNNHIAIARNESITKQGKAYCLTARYNGAVAWNSCIRKQRTMIPISESTEDNPNVYNGLLYRKLSPVECERLQTIDDRYTEGVSNSQRYKMIGNGFTVDVITGFLKSIITGEVKKVQHDLFS